MSMKCWRKCAPAMRPRRAVFCIWQAHCRLRCWGAMENSSACVSSPGKTCWTCSNAMVSCPCLLTSPMRLMMKMSNVIRPCLRAKHARKHGLITLLIFIISRMGDVRRQGQLTIAFEQVQHVFSGDETQAEEFSIAPQHLNRQCACQMQKTARLGRMAGAHLRQHFMLIQYTLNQHFDLAACQLLIGFSR